MALDESKAPVSNARMRPECCGNVLESWNDGMKTKGPPRARKRYPGIYASNGSWVANAKRMAPMASRMLPMIPLTRGPYLSRIVPTGRATTFVATAAVVNMKLSLDEYSAQPLCIPLISEKAYLISCS